MQQPSPLPLTDEQLARQKAFLAAVDKASETYGFMIKANVGVEMLDLSVLGTVMGLRFNATNEAILIPDWQPPIGESHDSTA